MSSSEKEAYKRIQEERRAKYKANMDEAYKKHNDLLKEMKDLSTSYRHMYEYWKVKIEEIDNG